MRLQRVTTNNRWIPEIDGLRFVAILSVLLVHVFAQMVNRTGPGEGFYTQHSFVIQEMMLLGRGVQVFFVISGYILAQPFLRQFQGGGKPVALSAFYSRRLTRLEPPYILALVLYAAAAIFFRHAAPRPIVISLLTSVFYIHNFFPHLPAVNFFTWSLEVEVMFYLLAPLIARVFAIPNPRLRSTIFLAAIVLFSVLPWGRMDQIGFIFPSQACFFLIGYLLADWQIHQRPDFGHPLWDLAGLALWPALFFFPDSRWTSPTLCLLLIACFCSTMFGPILRRLVSIRWVALLGGMCYSTYLLHMLIISALFPLSRRFVSSGHFYLSYVAQLLLLLPAIFAVSVAYYLLIERPCMDPHWPRELMRTLRGGRPALAGQQRESS